MVSEPTISVRQTFQVQYIVEGARSIRQFKIPRFKDFEIADAFDYNPTNFAGGNDPFIKIVVLVAHKKGRFTIPAATAVVNGKQMHSNTASIAVMSGMQGMNNINPDDIDTEEESILHPGDNIKDKIEKNLFLRVETSKNSCYVGEPLMVVYKAYSRLNASSQVMKRPSLTGFSVMEMVDAYDGKPEIEKLNGRSYYTNLVRKVQLFPLQEGKYTLDAAEIESVIHFIKTDEPAGKKGSGLMSNRNPRPMFPSAVNHRTILRTEPRTIIVKPLPASNQPEDFSGAVGQFNISIKVPATPIHKGDLVKIQLTISGKGNLSLITPPPIKWPKGVDTAEPTVKENINKYIFPLSGSKSFEYSFAAPDTGDYIIPAVHLSYFDPAEQKYKKASNDSITLHVLPGVKKVEVDESLSSQNSGVQPKFYWFGCIALIIIASIIYQVVSLQKGKKKGLAKVPVAVAPQEKPSPQKITAELLAKARLAIQYQQAPIFYHEVEQALWQVVADNWQVLPSKLNKHHITRVLTEKNVPAETIGNFLAILDECEWALYTPGHSVNSMETLMTRAEGLVSSLLEKRS